MFLNFKKLRPCNSEWRWTVHPPSQFHMHPLSSPMGTLPSTHLSLLLQRHCLYDDKTRLKSTKLWQQLVVSSRPWMTASQHFDCPLFPRLNWPTLGTMWRSRKMVQMNLSAKETQRHRRREQTYGYQGQKGRWDELGDWNWHLYTTMHKIGN